MCVQWRNLGFTYSIYYVYVTNGNFYSTILVRAECVRQRNEVAIKLGIISLSRTILVRAECVRQRNEVAIKLGIIFLSLLL